MVPAGTVGRMDVIGLTGGIAAGKSAVAARFAEHGARIIDADALAREAVEPGTPALAAVVDRFGPGVLTADGALDRAALGAIVFGDEQHRLALNAIVHPAVREAYARRVDAIEADDPAAVVIYDVPLLVEARAASEFSSVIVVDAPAATRIERLVTLRGMERSAAEARVAAQIPDAERRALADHVIDASGTLERTIEQVDALWESILAERAPRIPRP